MRCVLALTVVATALSAQSAYSTHAKPKSKSNAPAKPVVTRANAKKTTAAKPAGARVVTAKTHSTGPYRRRVNGRWVTIGHSAARPPKSIGQQHPDPDRYREIQKALQDRGYFKGEPNGEWKDDSTDALKRFQTAQNLPSDGKISALTLIDLGLGPKHDGGAVPPPPKLSPATPPPTSTETITTPDKPL
jgi:hypothetical protein